MSTVDFDSIVSLDQRPKGAGRVRRHSRRDFLGAVSKTAVGAGLATVGVMAMRVPGASADPYDMTPGSNCSGSSTFYASNPANDINKQCGPSPVCNDSTWLGGCRDANGWHRYYWPNNGPDAWKFRPNDCISGTGYDGWKWDVPGFGCSNKARFRCHDGFKVANYQPFNTIASHKTCI